MLQVNRGYLLQIDLRTWSRDLKTGGESLNKTERKVGINLTYYELCKSRIHVCIQYDIHMYMYNHDNHEYLKSREGAQ